MVHLHAPNFTNTKWKVAARWVLLVGAARAWEAHNDFVQIAMPQVRSKRAQA